MPVVSLSEGVLWTLQRSECYWTTSPLIPLQKEREPDLRTLVILDANQSFLKTLLNNEQNVQECDATTVS
jgi:hypothetical protein